ncbi:MAG TPA: guanine deaminase [Burkholderiaceae bacterium]|jgi:guanine deaminase|nr:guanine deaminase [Burkholderiaceae bacterium]
MQGYRGALLRFLADDTLERIDDALVVVDQGRIADVGSFDEVTARLPDVDWLDWRGRVMAPGFVDTHVHFPQLDVIGSPAEGLLPWLENYTFPHEARFADPAYAAAMAGPFLDELLRNGVTTAMVYCSSHAASADAFFEAAHGRSLRMVAGKCLMDRNSPESVRDDTRRGLVHSQALIERWHGKGRLGYAITPRFAPSCSEQQMRGAAELADAFPGTWVQTHVAENRDEITWVAQLFPKARSYLDVYDGLGLLRERSMYAHCIHLDATDRARLAASGASAAVCPTSNLFLGSGLFDFEAAAQTGLSWALASDVGGGTSFSPFRTMLGAYEVARLGGVTLSPQVLWYRHTLGAARAMGLDGLIGNLQPGHEADFIALDGRATPLLARRTAGSWSLDEWLFALIVLGDDRAIAETVVAGVPVPRP